MLASPTARVAIAIVGLGAFLRAYNVGVPELWIDEYGTRWVLADLPLGETVSRVVHFHGQSPLYYLIARVSCGLFGVSAFSLRLPSLLFGIGVLAVAYPLGVRLFRQRHAALVALALFAVNERLIFYSQDARPYALALLCAMLSFLFYVDLLGTDTAARRVAYVLSTAGAFYAHYLFGLVAVVQLLHLTAMRGGRWLRCRNWWLTWCGLAVLCLPALPHLLIIFNRRATLDWVPPRGWLALRDLAIRWFPARLWLPILASALLSGFSARQLRGLLDRRGATLLILWLALPMLAFELAPALLGASLLSERYVLFALPSALYLVTWPLALGREDSWRRWIPLVAVLVITVTGAYLTPPLSRGPTFAAHLDQGWSRAVRALDEEARREDVVLYWTGFVEANRVRLGHPDPLLISLLESPLTANLRPGHRLTLIGLPRSFEQPPPDDVSAALARAARATRVWIIALRDGAVPAASALRRDAGFEIAGTIRYGTVTLTLLQRT